MENGAISLMSERDGVRELRVPEEWDWRESYRIEKDYFWDSMPAGRKLILFAGLGIILFRRRLLHGVTRARVTVRAIGRKPSA